MGRGYSTVGMGVRGVSGGPEGVRRISGGEGVEGASRTPPGENEN